MNQQQLELTRLLGKKELSKGCLLYSDEYDTYNHFIRENSDGKVETIGDMYPSIEFWDKQELEIIGHPPTLSDLCKWLSSKNECWNISTYGINNCVLLGTDNAISYDFTKDILDQSEETIAQIIELIRNNH